jgi:S-formylglutathione hydrolase FrmB
MIMVAAVLGVPGVRAAVPGCDINTSTYSGGDPRVSEVTVAGRQVLVLVPPGYASSGQRYPVVFLLHGGGSNAPDWVANSDVVNFTARPDVTPAVVVMPGLDWVSFSANWQDGTHQLEDFMVADLVPWVDAHYRTFGDRSHRAIAGLSGGGEAALHLATRHPDVFVAVGSFSPPADNNHPMNMVALAFLGTYTPYCEGNLAGASPLAISDPVQDPLWAHANNPVELAGNLGGVSTWMASGNQIPCDAEDVATLQSFFPFAEFERWVHETTDAMDAALRSAGVAHTYDSYGCGVHSWRYFQRDLQEWWPVMTRALGGTAPASFDYRSADAAFSVYGWTVTADPARAPEFLDVTDASAHGVGLTGSGVTTVTTAPYFTPWQSVSVNGTAVSADSVGRITFTVDLGPAHTSEQFTAPALLQEAAGGYFTSRFVTFVP